MGSKPSKSKQKLEKSATNAKSRAKVEKAKREALEKMISSGWRPKD